jgi:cyclopropane-fatty-acyl-phospholipid synthase
MTTLNERLAAEGIHGPGSEEVTRFESHIARFLGREYERLAITADPGPVVADQGPMWCETDALMAHHYDADITFFRAFLDQRYMAYSMAYYGESPEAVRASSASLEEAQRAKLALVCNRAGLQGSERVLSIGCGFGPLETYLAETYPGVSVTSITVSQTQAKYIVACMHSPSHPLGHLDLRLVQKEFTALPVEELGGPIFDIVFAVAAFEHVHNFQAAIAKVAALLRPGGVAFVHLLISRIVVPRLFEANRSLTARYFPGGHVWPFDTITQHTATLDLEASWFINGLNYWRTLDEWHQGFWRNLPSLYPGTLDTEGVRHWNQYFSLCKACFVPDDGRVVGNGHFLLRKPG